MDKFKILVMFSNILDIPAKDDREAFSAVMIDYYFYGENGEKVVPAFVADGQCGTRSGRSLLDFDRASKVSYVPGIYDGTFEFTIGKDGKVILKLKDIDFVAKVAITAIPDVQPDPVSDAQPDQAADTQPDQAAKKKGK